MTRTYRTNNESGISLIAVAFFLIGVGLMLPPAIKLFEMQEHYSKSAETNHAISEIQESLSAFFLEHGRYPCPAPLDARYDTAEFGKEVLTDCTASDVPGTYRSLGRGGRNVRTGAVPVRTLGLDDTYISDQYGYRFIYAVTELYAVAGSLVTEDNGAIFIEDKAGNDATEVPGNIVYTLFSTGNDTNGAFTANGSLAMPCDITKLSGENCDFGANATFRNSALKSMGKNDYFAPKIAYSTSKTILPCEDKTTGDPVKDVAFLVDTSGSMELALVGTSVLQVCRGAHA